MKITEKRMCLHEDGTPYLQNTKTLYEVDGRLRFDNPEKIYELAKSLGCNRLAEEYVYIACLSSAGRIIGIFEISHGSVNASFLHAREIFQKLFTSMDPLNRVNNGPSLSLYFGLGQGCRGNHRHQTLRPSDNRRWLLLL